MVRSVNPKRVSSAGALALLLAAAACGSDPGPISPPVDNDLFVSEFDTFWDAFDATYPYFVFKGIDWDQARATFRPQAEAARTRDELVALLVEMVAPLRDLHVYFEAPSGDRVATYEPTGFVNWDRDTWLATIAPTDWNQLKPNLGFARLGGVPYIAIGAWNPNQFTNGDFDTILEQFRDDPAIILDVRPNGGGSDNLALLVAARFATAPVAVEFFQFRDGPEHADLGPFLERTLEPMGEWQFEGTVMVLSGRGVFSSNESFISAMRELPNVTIVGDTTGGASGNPQLLQLGGGWQYTVSRWIAYTADMEVIEWNGIPPDIYVATTPNDFAQLRDPVLEAALAAIAQASQSRD